jgi:hypothetical protein
MLSLTVFLKYVILLRVKLYPHLSGPITYLPPELKTQSIMRGNQREILGLLQ